MYLLLVWLLWVAAGVVAAAASFWLLFWALMFIALGQG